MSNNLIKQCCSGTGKEPVLQGPVGPRGPIGPRGLDGIGCVEDSTSINFSMTDGGCITGSIIISPDAGNQLSIHANGVYAGGGVPGGATTQIQYNNAGAFAGSAGLTYSGGRVTITSTLEQLRLAHDALNYFSIIVDSAGSVNLNLTGGIDPRFVFGNTIKVGNLICPTLNVDGIGPTTVGNTFGDVNIQNWVFSGDMLINIAGNITSSTFTASAPATYVITNVTTDRAYDANLTSLNEMADALGTLVADFRALGLLL